LHTTNLSTQPNTSNTDYNEHNNIIQTLNTSTIDTKLTNHLNPTMADQYTTTTIYNPKIRTHTLKTYTTKTPKHNQQQNHQPNHQTHIKSYHNNNHRHNRRNQRTHHKLNPINNQNQLHTPNRRHQKQINTQITNQNHHHHTILYQQHQPNEHLQLNKPNHHNPPTNIL